MFDFRHFCGRRRLWCSAEHLPAGGDGVLEILYLLSYQLPHVFMFAVPNAVVALLYYYEVLDCDSISVPLLITFYISTSNRYELFD